MVTAELWFALEYARNRPLARRSLVLLSIPVLISSVLILTNSAHHWIWAGFSLEQGDVQALRGNVAWVPLGYSQLLALAIGVVFIRLFIRSSLYRWVAALMLCELIITRAAFPYCRRRLGLPPGLERAFLRLGQ